MGRLEEEAPLARKAVDDVLGGDEAWASVDRTQVACPLPDCGGAEAYFMQIQTRSATRPGQASTARRWRARCLIAVARRRTSCRSRRARRTSPRPSSTNAARAATAGATAEAA